jgi:hypothetical protein
MTFRLYSGGGRPHKCWRGAKGPDERATDPQPLGWKTDTN